jgi:hypothetical protein
MMAKNVWQSHSDKSRVFDTVVFGDSPEQGQAQCGSLREGDSKVVMNVIFYAQ